MNTFSPNNDTEATAPTPSRSTGKQVFGRILKVNTLTLKLTNGEQYWRFLNPGGKWNQRFEVVRCEKGDDILEVVSPKTFGDQDLFTSVQVELYKSHRPLMFTKTNPTGFRFRSSYKAACVAAEFRTNMDGPGLQHPGILLVSVSRPARENEPVKEIWGDPLLTLPTVKVASMPGEPESFRWGAIADAVNGRLIKSTGVGVGTRDVAVKWEPVDIRHPLGTWEGKTLKIADGMQYFVNLCSSINVLDSLERISFDDQVQLIQHFVPAGPLLTTALEVIAKVQSERVKTSPTPAAALKTAVAVNQLPSGAVATATVAPPATENVEHQGLTPDQLPVYEVFKAYLRGKLNPSQIKTLITAGAVSLDTCKVMSELPYDNLKKLVKGLGGAV